VENGELESRPLATS